MVNALKFRTLVACQNSLDKQHRPNQTASEDDQGLPCLLFYWNNLDILKEFYQFIQPIYHMTLLFFSE